MEIQTTRHFEQRVRQRGFTSAQIQLLLSYGICTPSGYLMSQKRGAQEIDLRKREIRDLKVAVVSTREAISSLRAKAAHLEKGNRCQQEKIVLLRREISSIECLARKRTLVVCIGNRLITVQRADKWKVRRELRR